jgi:uncharacterized membrane protein YdjX (TVP38/TMEM64 family)
MNRIKQLSGIISVLVILLGTLLFFTLIGTERITDFVSSLGIFGPAVFFFIHTISIVFAPLEGSFLMLSSAAIFESFWFAVFLVSVGGFVGSSINFWLARKYGQKVVRRFAGEDGLKTIHKYTDRVNKHPLLLLPLMATTLFDLMGYGAGLTNIKYRNFLLAVTISTVINVPIYVAVGDNIISNERGLVIVISLLVGVLGLYGILLLMQRLWHKKKVPGK